MSCPTKPPLYLGPREIFWYLMGNTRPPRDFIGLRVAGTAMDTNLYICPQFFPRLLRTTSFKTIGTP
jgi:hypothetical protein